MKFSASDTLLSLNRRNLFFNYYFFLILFILIQANPLIGQSPEFTFERANKFYIEKDYKKAIEWYEKLVKSENKSAEIYFNIGNAYYKSGDYASAILNYERAKKLNPSDGDIEFNLRLANQNTIDKIEPAPQVFYVKWINNFINSSSIEGRTQKALLFIWIALAIAAIYIFVNNGLVKRITFFAAAIMLMLGSFFLYVSHLQVSELKNNKSAIITSTNVYIKSSPDENSINLFLLHSGTKVEVVDELQGWKRIRIANGNEGWINAKAIEVV